MEGRVALTPTGTLQVIAGLYLVAITLRWLKYVLDVKYVLDGTYTTDAPEDPPALPAGTEAGSGPARDRLGL